MYVYDVSYSKYILNPHAVVTGASEGIGRGYALEVCYANDLNASILYYMPWSAVATDYMCQSKHDSDCVYTVTS